MNCSSTEHYMVQKGDVGCIFGSVSPQGIIWSNILADYLLERFCDSVRYDLVVCFTFDRKESDLRRYLNHSQQQKLNIYSCSESNEIIQRLEQTTVFAGKVVSVFIFSFSDIVINEGLSAACGLILKLQKLLTPTNAERPSYALCLVVHESLHSNVTLNRIQSLVRTFLVVKPNIGLLSDDVLMEVLCTRRSLNSGKVIEDVDMFVANNSKNKGSFPIIHLRKIQRDENSENASKSYSERQELTNLDGSIPTTDAKTSSDQLPMKQLITFDSTDPEFDEDEDPDNDLDL